MRWKTAILALVSLSLLASLFADDAPTQAIGQNNFGAVVLESFQGAGLIKLNGTTVQNTLRVTGSLISQGAHIGSLDIVGEANLSNTTIQKASTVLGSVQAVHSTFQQSLTLQTQKAVFTATKLEGITIQKNMGFKGKQIIELRVGTEVNGPIVFESGKGEVLVYPGSRLLSTVTGGKIVKKS